MKLLLLLSLLISSAAFAQDGREMLVMFWNLENYFDWKDGGGGESDTEFSTYGPRHWTSERFHAKSRAVAKSVWWIADEFGGLPDMIGVAEVENRDVLTRLLHSTSLSKAGYSIIHYESHDRRGIDVALLWRGETLELKSSGICRVPGLETRDILVADFTRRADGSEVAAVTVHLPSKYGGGKTAWKRRKAAARLREAVDSIRSSGIDNVIVMGDFNDTPESREFNVLKPVLTNAAEPLAARGEGSIRFDGKWDLIDMFWTSGELPDVSSMSVVRIPFLMVRDNVMGGEKPLRTYSGPRYVGGVSDHCPVILEIKSCNHVNKDKK